MGQIDALTHLLRNDLVWNNRRIAMYLALSSYSRGLRHGQLPIRGNQGSSYP